MNKKVELAKAQPSRNQFDLPTPKISKSVNQRSNDPIDKATPQDHINNKSQSTDKPIPEKKNDIHLDDLYPITNHKRHNKTVLTPLLTMIIFAVIIATAYYGYLQYKKNSKVISTKTNTALSKPSQTSASSNETKASTPKQNLKPKNQANGLKATALTLNSPQLDGILTDSTTTGLDNSQESLIEAEESSVNLVAEEAKNKANNPLNRILFPKAQRRKNQISANSPPSQAEQLYLLGYKYQHSNKQQAIEYLNQALPLTIDDSALNRKIKQLLSLNQVALKRSKTVPTQL